MKVHLREGVGEDDEPARALHAHLHLQQPDLLLGFVLWGV
jgi:hypothetical protein